MRRYGAPFVASLVVLGIYVAALEIFPKAVFWHPDEGAKFITLQTIRWDRGLRYEVPYRGRVNDPAFNFYPGQCGYGVIYPSPEPSGTVRFSTGRSGFHC